MLYIRALNNGSMVEESVEQAYIAQQVGTKRVPIRP
jgi:hypothetical protein